MHRRTYFPNNWSQMWDISGTLEEYTMAVPYSWVLSKPQLIKGSFFVKSEPLSLPTLLESDRWTHSICIKPSYQHA